MKVIDISKHQGNMDFNKVKQNGVEAVMLRASYASSKDSKLDEYTNQCALPYGVYTFSTWHYDESSLQKAMTNIDCQSEKLLTYLQDKNFSKIVAVDMELEKGHTVNLSKSELTQAVNYYCDKLSAAGYKPLVYCSASWLTDRFVLGDIKYPLWVAFYNNAGFNGDTFPNNRYGNVMSSVKDKIALWQYSSAGVGSEYGASSERVDLDHGYKLFEELLGSCPQLEPQPQKPHLQSNAITVGSIVKVKQGAKTYDNGHIASFVFNKAYRVDQLKGKRAVMDLKGICTPVNVNDLYLVGSAPVLKPVKIGSKVRVRKGAKTYNGKKIASFVFNNTYRVDQLKGKRAVLDLHGICTPVNVNDLEVV